MYEPLVNICIPAYNAEKTIERTIQSLIAQTYKNLEIIVVDNCSVDRTASIVRSFSDNRVKVYSNDEHLPAAEYNWNRCFNYATGKYLAVFHADDIYSPDIISRQVETFRKYPEVAGVFTQGTIIDDNDIPTGTFKLPEEIKGNHPYTYKELLNAILVHADFLPTPSAMIKTDIYLKCAPVRYDQFASASDLDMWLRVAEQGKIIILNERLLNYRVSRLQGSYHLNLLRTKESDFFKVMDYHLARNKDVPRDVKMSYELSRFGDKVLCQINFLRQYLGLLVLNPESLFTKFKMLLYFRVFKK